MMVLVLTLVSLLVDHAGACVDEMDCSLNVMAITVDLHGKQKCSISNLCRFVRRGVVMLEFACAIQAGADMSVAS